MNRQDPGLRSSSACQGRSVLCKGEGLSNHPVYIAGTFAAFRRSKAGDLQEGLHAFNDASLKSEREGRSHGNNSLKPKQETLLKGSL
eukprot:4661211-Amphidinium_carterae.1